MNFKIGDRVKLKEGKNAKGNNCICFEGIIYEINKKNIT